MMDVAEEVIVPMMDSLVRVDRESLTIGYAGVYSTFLHPSRRYAAKYGVPARDILIEVARRNLIGGQEDMIEDTAMTMAKERGLLQDVA
jgi:4-hydroxy-2-oxovalerate/4-hydroxy-2-oxohexanoate aldolase